MDEGEEEEEGEGDEGDWIDGKREEEGGEMGKEAGSDRFGGTVRITPPLPLRPISSFIVLCIGHCAEKWIPGNGWNGRGEPGGGRVRGMRTFSNFCSPFPPKRKDGVWEAFGGHQPTKVPADEESEGQGWMMGTDGRNGGGGGSWSALEAWTRAPWGVFPEERGVGWGQFGLIGILGEGG